MATPLTDALDTGLYGYSDLRRTLPQLMVLTRRLEESHARLLEELSSMMRFSGPGKSYETKDWRVAEFKADAAIAAAKEITK